MSNKNQLSAGEIPLMILTNERTPHKANMIMMLYKACSLAQLAYMDGMDPETGEIVPLLVGLGPTEDGKFNVYPLARIFNKVDGIPQYLVPDGHGSYIDYRTPEQRELAGITEGDIADGIPAGSSDEDGRITLVNISEEETGQATEGNTSTDGDGGTLDGPPTPAV